ncbi:MAG: aldolase/citrate lyase family protein [Bacillota bacterium]
MTVGYGGTLKRRIHSGQVLVGTSIVGSRSPFVVEVFKMAGFDFIIIDREHSVLTTETAADLITVARHVGIPVLVRVPDYSYHELNPLLDQGVHGIVLPRVRTRDEVEDVLRRIRYFPLGHRGLAGSTTPLAGYDGHAASRNGFTDQVNQETVVCLQIETREAMENLDEILSVYGVDVALVGPDDLALNLGILGQKAHPTFIQAVQEVIATANRYGVAPGIALGDMEGALTWRNEGVKVVWYSCDIGMLIQHGSGAVRELKGARKVDS